VRLLRCQPSAASVAKMRSYRGLDASMSGDDDGVPSRSLRAVART